ncbi:MAG: FecR domain-containing protein [Elusimicrobia bacterium]|nr:FecR domain-containing protein [Elusimicrobiota bacterium]
MRAFRDAAFLALWGGLPVFAAAQAAVPGLLRIGSAAIVRGRVEARSEGSPAVGRVLGSGQPVYLNDRITTDAAGRLQILLRDETVFTIGPNTSLVLDEFVYDPSSGIGAASVSVIQGVFRFITGKIARRAPSNMKVRLPMCTIGIHGTDVMGVVAADQATVVLKSGRITVANEAGSTDVDRPDFATVIAAGSAPSQAFAASREMLDSLGGPLSPSKPAPAGPAVPGQAQDAPASEEPAPSGPVDTTSLDAHLASVEQQTPVLPEGAVSSWDSIRQLQGIGAYDASAAFNGVGAAFPPGTTWDIHLSADFNARSFVPGSAASITTPPGPTGNFNTTLLNLPSWDGLSGAATLTFGMVQPGCTASTCFYTIFFVNRDGQAGGQIDAAVAYDDGANTGSGSMTIPRR